MKKKYIQRPFEMKSLSEDGVFTGYGSVFGELDSYRDIVLKGAFTKTLERHAAQGRKVKMLWQHNTRQPIGVYREIREDDYGLYVEGEINMEVQQGREAHSLMKQGALDGLSIGYDTVKDRIDKEKRARLLEEVNLWEISPVTFPAGDSARVIDVKTFDQWASLSDVEDYLREQHGLSQTEACATVSRMKALILNPSESGSKKGARELLEALQGVKELQL